MSVERFAVPVAIYEKKLVKNNITWIMELVH
jgi:hypothetical protein